MTRPPEQGSSSDSDWYDDSAPERELLRAMRRLQRARRHMHHRATAEMELNPTDLKALQLIIAGERADDPLTASALAAELGISTASTAKLLNRLTSTGHLRRVRHPRDGRSVTVIAQPLAHERVRVVMTQPHDRMLEAARRVPEESRQAVLDFLADMTQAFEGTGEPPHQAADRKI